MAYYYKQPLEESRTKTLKGDASERWVGLWEMCFNWVRYQRLALSSKCSLHCLIYENGPGLFKYLFLCHLTRCQILSVEGAGETLWKGLCGLPPVSRGPKAPAGYIASPAQGPAGQRNQGHPMASSFSSTFFRGFCRDCL